MILKNETRIVDFHVGMELPENLNRLSEEHLRLRQVVYLDILNTPCNNYGDYDIHGVSCEEAQIHELHSQSGQVDESKLPDWINEYKGNMVLVVKTITFEFKWWGLQTIVEKIVTEKVFHDMFLGTHKAMVKYCNDWYNMTEKDLDKYENTVADELKEVEFNIDDDKKNESAPKEQGK